MHNVKSVRSRIDGIDQKILKLLNERLGLAREVGKIKQGKNIFVPEREEEVFKNLKEIAEKEHLPWELVQSVFTEVVSLCRAAQGKLHVHVLGPVGTHSYNAAFARFGEKAGFELHSSIAQTVQAAQKAAGRNAFAVVPIENSGEGSVGATVDALLTTPLTIISEGYWRVQHALLSTHGALDKIKVVYSHPMGIAQCRRFLEEKLPHAKCIEVSSTALAAEKAAAAQTSEGAAAIGALNLARGKLKALARDIQGAGADTRDNVTRFVVLGANETKPTGEDKTSIVFSLPNRSGSLTKALGVFSKHKINMTKIESRPHNALHLGLQWEYLFFIDIDGHVDSPKVAKALKSFGDTVKNFKILGAYPKGRLWN